MTKRKKRTEPISDKLPLDNPPLNSIARPLSQLDIQARIYGFSNLDKHAGIEEMTMAAQIDVSDSFLRRLGHELLIWADLPTSLIMQDYFSERNIFLMYVYRWIERHEYFKNCYILAKEKIGSRREKLGLFGDGKTYSPGIMSTMPIYSHEHKWLKEWASELAAKAKVTPEPTKVTFIVERGSDEQQHGSGADNGPDMRSSVGDQSTDREAGAETKGSGEPEESV